MRSTLSCAFLLGAAGPVAAEETVVAAFASDSSVTIYKLAPAGIGKVYADTAGWMSGAGWTDARTLWVVHHDERNAVWVNKVVDGKLTDKRAIPVEAWKLVGDAKVGPRLKITITNEVWVKNCLVPKADLTCARGTWIRVDAGTQIVRTTEPAGIDHDRAQGHPRARSPAFPASKSPKGYSVTLQQVVVDQRKVNGAVCKGPSSSTTWPDARVDLDFAMKPARVTWLRETPAVARIEGTAKTPLGTSEPAEAVFLDCKDVADQASWLGAGYWGLRRAEVWTIYSGDKAIGSIAGYDVRTPPSKK